MKWRNSKERELLASGGSRDQTLPNKNNPNPDLSDAKTDRAPSLSPPSSPITEQQLRSNSNQSTSNKSSPLDAKFIALNNNNNNNNNNKKSNDFKYEIDEINSRSSSVTVHPPIGQLFNNFYDNHSSDGSVKNFNSQNGQVYYDEYDSNSDDSEEINVT